jgi:AcrR family transcriptional regulator
MMTATSDEKVKAPAGPRASRLRRAIPQREDWLDAGLEMIAETGADGLVIENLIRRCGSTKAVFARQFGDRAGYLDAMVDYWELGQVDALIDLHARRSAPSEKLREFFYAILPELEPGGAELAIRSWARRHRLVQASVNAIDARRAVYLEDAFRELGCDDAEAVLRASFFVGLILAEGLVDRGEDSEVREARIAMCLEAVTSDA